MRNKTIKYVKIDLILNMILQFLKHLEDQRKNNFAC